MELNSRRAKSFPLQYSTIEVKENSHLVMIDPVLSSPQLFLSVWTFVPLCPVRSLSLSLLCHSLLFSPPALSPVTIKLTLRLHISPPPSHHQLPHLCSYLLGSALLFYQKK